MGYFYFKEAISIKWIIGSLFIVAGVGVIALKNPKKQKEI